MFVTFNLNFSDISEQTVNKLCNNILFQIIDDICFEINERMKQYVRKINKKQEEKVRERNEKRKREEEMRFKHKTILSITTSFISKLHYQFTINENNYCIGVCCVCTLPWYISSDLLQVCRLYPAFPHRPHFLGGQCYSIDEILCTRCQPTQTTLFG